jgi:hypothetical protein
MPMPKSRTPGPQLDLFHPIPTRPQWRNLPPEVRSRVSELLVQLMQAPSPLTGQSHDGLAADPGKEVGDE